MLTGDTPLRIATSRYAARDLIIASGLVPIATSVGLPRWDVGFRIVEQVRALCPFGLLGIDDRGEFTRRYTDRLNGYGADTILSVLAGIARREERAGVVLLCWEDITKPGVWCHRTVAARWIQQPTSQLVSEL